ncbi:MAG: LysM peptidoglycan-binding domain-containing protein, partial [Nitrococcus sp.]|nr:LysM peptidoglycan-binding domain-containing protein [Nitrococcus sp.]
GGERAFVVGARAGASGSAAALLLAGCAQLGVEKPTSRPPSSAAHAKVQYPADSSSASEALTIATTSAPTAPSAPTDLWARIRHGFELPEAEDQPLVLHDIEYFTGRQRYLDRIAERARPYLSYIVQALQERGMPMEIALLPIVESAFRPFAYSAGQAAGIWQFIPTTAEYYGLKQNWWYDGRRDVIAATRAALDYLQRLNELFHGDWLLTIAAYNAGEGTVLRAIKHNAAQGRQTGFWHLNLPSETEAYVPRLLALRSLIATPAAYGLKLPPIPNEIPIAVVEIRSQIDLALAARLAGITVTELVRLNPGYNRWATAPNGPHRLVLPVDRVARFREGLAAIPPEARVHWRRHQVVAGDTLSGLARRYGTTLAALKGANALRSSLIRTGSYLIVPLPRGPASAEALTNWQRYAVDHDLTYVVRRGDSLWSIARAHRSTVSRLCRLNQIAAGAILHPGQELILRPPQPISLAIAGLQPDGMIQAVRYTVQQGDSLYQIARRFNVTISDLRRWNDLTKGEYLQPGQELQLRVDVTHVGG